MNLNLEEEIWKEIQGYEGLYAVSSKGRVKNIMSGKVLKNKIDGAGYLAVGLKGKNYNIHRLMAQAFIPNPDNLPQVHHKDENKLNNVISNLEWVSASKNVRHSIYKQSFRINQYTLGGEFIKTWDSLHQIERETGLKRQTISKVCKGKQTHAYNYKWRYLDKDYKKEMYKKLNVFKDEKLIATFNSVPEAAKELGINSRSIYTSLYNDFNLKGYKFQYLD